MFVPDPETRRRKVAPVRERGLKFVTISVTVYTISRSRKGAWIEIEQSFTTIASSVVAPVRERGLKSVPPRQAVGNGCVAPVRERGLK